MKHEKDKSEKKINLKVSQGKSNKKWFDSLVKKTNKITTKKLSPFSILLIYQLYKLHKRFYSAIRYKNVGALYKWRRFLYLFIVQNVTGLLSCKIVIGKYCGFWHYTHIQANFFAEVQHKEQCKYLNKSDMERGVENHSVYLIFGKIGIKL